MIIRIIKDPVTQMAAFQAGEIDFIASFSPEHVNTLKVQNPGAQIMTGPETTPMVAMMRITVPCDGKGLSENRCPHLLFNDIRVRKAVGCYGMNRDESTSTQGESYLNLMESHFNIQRRLYDYQFSF